MIFAKIFDVNVEMLNADDMCKNHYKHFTYKRDIWDWKLVIFQWTEVAVFTSGKWNFSKTAKET